MGDEPPGARPPFLAHSGPDDKRGARPARLGCALGVALALALAALGARGAEPELAWSTGASPCTLVEGVPAAAHPIRQQATLAGAFKGLDKAGLDPRKNARAHDQFVKVLDRLLAAAVPAFKQPAPGKAFAPGPAQRFLAAHVLAANAPLRVGLERFEPAPEVLAAMVLAACRAERPAEAIALGRGATLTESAPQRAFAALLLVQAGRLAEARELASTLGDEGFLAPFVRAELALDPAERAAHHALAGRRRVTPDQDLAWQLQTRRLN